MTAPENPAAFPCSPGGVPYWNEGMTLRDWFAGQALPAIIRSMAAGDYQAPPAGMGSAEMATRDAYRTADAMLAAREQKA